MPGLKIALEIKKQAPGTLLKDFIATMNTPDFRNKLKDLSDRVAAFASKFPLPIVSTFL